ncbi:MAG TPA: cell surface protein [bacterium]|nr:cell surface protein [bacterium]
MKRFCLSIAVAFAVAGCNAGEFPARRVVQYSTSPGFQPVSPEEPNPSESPEPPVDEGVDGEPAIPPEEPPSDGPSDGETPPDPRPEDGPVEAPLPAGADPFADRVVSFHIGDGGGFNEEDLPGIVLGAPRGGGLFQGSFHVLSLGLGGEIVLEMTDFLIFDGDGPDFTVFENAFLVSGSSGVTFAEPGIVGVSEDGVNFVEFACDASAAPYAGCAGVTPVLANADLNDVDPTDPAVSGGDAFDLNDVGLMRARFVRIRDSGLGLGPIGPGTRGFDLDAVAVIHGTLPK